MTVGEESRLTAAVKWSRSIEGKWRVEWNLELLLINNFSSCTDNRRRVGLEWESVRQRKRGVVHCGYASALALFVGWRAIKRRLLASLIWTTDKCWSIGRQIPDNGATLCQGRICWIVSGIFECGTAETLDCC